MITNKECENCGKFYRYDSICRNEKVILYCPSCRKKYFNLKGTQKSCWSDIIIGNNYKYR